MSLNDVRSVMCCMTSVCLPGGEVRDFVHLQSHSVTFNLVAVFLTRSCCNMMHSW